MQGLPVGKLTLYINGLKDREESPAFKAEVRDGKNVTLDLRVLR